MKRAHIKLTGQVQGLGFRFYVQHIAVKKDIKGWVRNDKKACLEIMAEGTELALKELVQHCRKGPRFAVIKKINVDYSEAHGRFHSFSIRH